MGFLLFVMIDVEMVGVWHCKSSRIGPDLIYVVVWWNQFGWSCFLEVVMYLYVVLPYFTHLYLECESDHVIRSRIILIKL